MEDPRAAEENRIGAEEKTGVTDYPAEVPPEGPISDELDPHSIERPPVKPPSSGS